MGARPLLSCSTAVYQVGHLPILLQHCQYFVLNNHSEYAQILNFHNSLHNSRVCGSRCEYCPYECEGPPHRVLDALATTQVDDVETKVPEPVVRLKEGRSGIWTVILHGGGGGGSKP